MASTAGTHLRRRLGVLIAGAAVLTALITVTAAASMPAVEAPAPGLTRPGTTTSTTSPSSTRPRTPIPGFLLDRGTATKFDAPQARLETAANSINNRGQIVGAYENTNATPSPQAPGMQPLGLMRQGDLAAVVSDSPEDL
ncbi:MAG TPA: hypothetical protein VFL71_17995 [Actinomycetes bacterium]|nr:hypothetical protein [Actinomycetes bacterium]